MLNIYFQNTSDENLTTQLLAYTIKKRYKLIVHDQLDPKLICLRPGNHCNDSDICVVSTTNLRILMKLAETPMAQCH